MRSLARTAPLALLLIWPNIVLGGGIDSVALQKGTWRAWLESPGGPLPFSLELHSEPPSARIRNGAEVVELSRVERDGMTLELAFDDYDAMIRARIGEDGRSLTGMWRRRLGPSEWSRLAFKAVAGETHRFEPDSTSPASDRSSLLGRWAAQLADLPEVSVLQLEAGPDDTVRGTILNYTGDYRYLEGRVDGDRIRLSRFDGAHAFLLDATRDADGILTGTFVEANYRQTGFTARLDPEAPSPPTFESFSFSGRIAMEDRRFLDLNGVARSLRDLVGDAEAVIVEVFGTWCPNCHDASRFLDELYARYAERGLAVVGLAFEMTTDSDRNLRFVKRYWDKHRLSYPVLLGFDHEPSQPSEIFSMIEGPFGYPTVLFVRGDGTVHAVHTGFAGPATGAAHSEVRAQFESIVLELLRGR